jgi:predicted Zn-dependent peptidase
VKVADVRAFRDASLTTENMMVTATGDVDVDSLASTLSRALAKVPRTAIARAKVPAPEPSCTRKVIALDDAGSQQTTLSIAYPGVPANHADVAALEVLAAAAGGSLAARLNVSLRKGLGLSYGFAAELRTMREGGLFSVHGDVDPARTVEALRALDETLETLTRIPLGDDDLRIAKIRAAHSASRLRGVAAAVRIAASKILGVSLSDASKLKAVTSQEVRAAAEHYLQPAKRCIVAVGSAARIERELETAGLGPVSRAP